MKNIYNKIKISNYLIIIIFLSLISGLFKDIITFIFIIIFHELGHIILSLIYKWNINEINIGIYGGYIIYDDIIDKPLYQELIISLGGILFQIILYFIYYLLFKYNYIDLKYYLMFNKYNLSIILFNIIPIYPLDGSKIISVIINKFFSYKKSLFITSFISCASLIIIITYLIIYNIKLKSSYVIIFVFLTSKLYNYNKEIPYLYNRFLYEKYVYKNNYKKSIIKKKKLDKLKRNKCNYFIIDNKCYSEKIILSKLFD